MIIGCYAEGYMFLRGRGEMRGAHAEILSGGKAMGELNIFFYPLGGIGVLPSIFENGCFISIRELLGKTYRQKRYQ